jgi:pilus assembly protein Flp/PilA
MCPMRQLNALLTDEDAVTAIEYGLLAALIVVVIIGGISATGGAVNEVYERWTSAVIDAIT